MQESSPARVYAAVAGVFYLATGIIGFFYSAEFTSNYADSNEIYGFIATNGWSNVFSILFGLVGIVAFMAGDYVSHRFAIAGSLLLAVIGLWALILGEGEMMLGMFPTSTGSGWTDIVFGAFGLLSSGSYAVAAGAAVVLVLGFAIPGVVTSDNDNETQIGRGQELFVANGCANCHTLADSDSAGTIGPNLNDLKPGERQVLAAIENGGQGSGSMPPDLANGQNAEDIAAYVAYASGAAAPPPGGGPPGKGLFVQTCGSCHTLANAGTTGAVGPNLDQLAPSDKEVQTAIKVGPGAMPPTLLTGKDATDVAKYVSSVAGKK